MNDFDSWVSKVDVLLQKEIGIISGDLEDWVWYNCFQENMSAADAVHTFINEVTF